jgi:hypothetical protein
MMNDQADSPVVALIRHIYGYSGGKDKRKISWQQLNPALSGALRLAIEAGFKFEKDDFATVFKQLAGGYWFGTDNDHSQGERFYTAAVNADNRSACISFEAWKGRKPFLREGRRLCIGSELKDWNPADCQVTSFAEDALSLTACVYADCQLNGHALEFQRGVLHRFKITHADLKAECADKTERADLNAKLLRFTQAQPGHKAKIYMTATDVLFRLKVKTKQEYARVPIDRIRKLLTELETAETGDALLERVVK